MKTLSDTDYSQTLAAVLDHLAVEGRITNADVRSLTKLRYDQVVIFFNRAMAEGHIADMRFWRMFTIPIVQTFRYAQLYGHLFERIGAWTG